MSLAVAISHMCGTCHAHLDWSTSDKKVLLQKTVRCVANTGLYLSNGLQNGSFENLVFFTASDLPMWFRISLVIPNLSSKYRLLIVMSNVVTQVSKSAFSSNSQMSLRCSVDNIPRYDLVTCPELGTCQHPDQRQQNNSCLTQLNYWTYIYIHSLLIDLRLYKHIV